MFNLTTNYRSHAAIIGCAHSVIELITEYWLGSIDSLPREKSTTGGPRPIFFGDQNEKDLDHSLFGDPCVYQAVFVNITITDPCRSSDDHIEFGAHQCEPFLQIVCDATDTSIGILVRDEAARDRLRGGSESRSIGHILYAQRHFAILQPFSITISLTALCMRARDWNLTMYVFFNVHQYAHSSVLEGLAVQLLRRLPDDVLPVARCSQQSSWT